MPYIRILLIHITNNLYLHWPFYRRCKFEYNFSCELGTVVEKVDKANVLNLLYKDGLVFQIF